MRLKTSSLVLLHRRGAEVRQKSKLLRIFFNEIQTASKTHDKPACRQAGLKQRADFIGKPIYVGMDVHLKSWDITICFDQQFIRSFHQLPSASKLIATLQRDYPNATFQCAYEAGFSGFGLHRQLTEAGLSCMVEIGRAHV